MVTLVQKKEKSTTFCILACLLVAMLMTDVEAFCDHGVRHTVQKHCISDCISCFMITSDGESEIDHEDDSAFNQLKISFVTGNEMKAKEMNMILRKHMATKGPNDETSLVDLKILNVDLPEIQEVSTEAIAKNKAIQAAQLANGPIVVEDTSLQFDALGGMPGPFIKFFQQKLKSEGLYKLLLAYEDKSAAAVCTLAFCPYPHADPVLFTGTTTGRIVEPVPGAGFGWDSIFVPDGSDRPFSMMTTEEKNVLSHRGQAVRQWADWLGQNRQELWERQRGKYAVGHMGLNFKGESNKIISED